MKNYKDVLIITQKENSNPVINELKKDKRIEFIQNECARLSNSDNPAERVKKAGDCPYGSWTLYAFHLLYENLHTEIKPTLLERLWPFNKN